MSLLSLMSLHNAARRSAREPKGFTRELTNLPQPEPAAPRAQPLPPDFQRTGAGFARRPAGSTGDAAASLRPPGPPPALREERHLPFSWKAAPATWTY